MHPNLPNRGTQAKREPSPEVSSLIADLEARTDKSDPNQRFYLVMLKRYRKQLEEYVQKQFEGKTEKQIALPLIQSIIGQYTFEDKERFEERNPSLFNEIDQNNEKFDTYLEYLANYIYENQLVNYKTMGGVPYLEVPPDLLPIANNTGAYCWGMGDKFEGMVFYEITTTHPGFKEKAWAHELTHVIFEALNNSGVIDLRKNYTEKSELHRNFMYKFTHEFLAYNSDKNDSGFVGPSSHFSFDISEQPLNEIHKIFLDKLKHDIAMTTTIWTLLIKIGKKTQYFK